MTRFILCIILILISLSKRSSGFEIGALQAPVKTSFALAGPSNFDVYSNAPIYIWRSYEEHISSGNIEEQYLMRATTSRAHRHLGVRAHIEPSDNRITFAFKNLRSTSIGLANMANLDNYTTWYHIRHLKPTDSETTPYGFDVYSSMTVSIPWEVPDGTYTFRGVIRNFYYGSGDKGGRSGNPIPFQLKTYLNIDVDDINFGKIIFSRNSSTVTRKGDIRITGGQLQNIKIEVPHHINLTTPNSTNNIPIYLNLVDNEIKGTTLEKQLNENGQVTLQLEALLDPKLYPDASEGRYSGDAVITVSYN